MSKPKKIAWQSWNAVVQDFYQNDTDLSILEELMSSQEEGAEFPMRFLEPAPRVLYTPYGPQAADSFLKPSDRWDCWIAYTNFDVTTKIRDEVELVDGVEAIKIMGRYTFFIGVGKLFNATEVKLNIENCIADTGHMSAVQAVTEDLRDILEEVKTQVRSKPHWSIFVSSKGEIDYIMSDTLNDKYLHDLNKLEDLRNKIGGIIIRSSNEQKH